MLFAKHLREGIRRGRIRCTVRIWHHPRVKAGGRYPMDDGHVVVESIAAIRMKDVTSRLARESGFASVAELMRTAKHGAGDTVYLIRFRYLAAGAWDVPRKANPAPHEEATLLDRIERSSPPRPRKRRSPS